MPSATIASIAATDAARPEISTVPPRVHAHSARSTTGAVTEAVGTPFVAHRPGRAGRCLAHLDQPPPIDVGRDELDGGARLVGRPVGQPAPHHIDSVVNRAGRYVSGDRTDRQARGQLGVHAMHRRFVGLHPAGEADRLVRRPPRPARRGVVEPAELVQQGGRRPLAQRE